MVHWLHCWPRTVRTVAWERPPEGESVSNQPSRVRSIDVPGILPHPHFKVHRELNSLEIDRKHSAFDPTVAMQVLGYI